MNQEESIELFLKGKDAWNAWAEDMLAEKQSLIDAGKWKVYEKWDVHHQIYLTSSEVPETQAWLEKAFVDFSSMLFVVEGTSSEIKQQGGEGKAAFDPAVRVLLLKMKRIDFEGFIFPSEVTFYGSNINSHAAFNKTSFNGNALFNRVSLNGNARFIGASFNSNAEFNEIRFNGNAAFNGASFKGNAGFNSAIFKGNAEFHNASFKGYAGFNETSFHDKVAFIRVSFKSNAGFYETRFHGNAGFDYSNFKSTAEFIVASFNSHAGFFETSFEGHAGFHQAKFKGDAMFIGAKFKGNAGFNSANFKGNVEFNSASFRGDAWFNEASFNRPARFLKTSFEKLLSFDDTKFNFGASFTNAKFEDFALFRRTTLFNFLDFSGVSSKRLIDFSDAQFHFFIPDFTLLEYEKPPRLDRIEIRSVNRREQTFEEKDKDPRPYLLKFMGVAPDKDAYLNFRNLKKIAIEGHDHINELDMFIDEMKARRFWLDKPFEISAGTLRFWLGTIYGGVSDWGRSLWRPLGFWVAILFLFVHIYACIGVMSQFSTTAYQNNILYERWWQHAILTLTHPCSNADHMKSFDAALTISAKNALPFISLEGSEKLERAYTCLFGVAPLYDISDYPRAKIQLAPIIPNGVSYSGTVHTVISFILIFLIVLALRNHFKIK